MTNNDIVRFFSYVKIRPDCWLWIGPKRAYRYGKFFFRGKHLAAHRFMYELCHGEIPLGLIICHTCDVPLCVNPKHLYAGTQKDNMRDCIERKRNWNIQKSHCRRGHPFNADNTRISVRKNGNTYRNCRICVKNLRQEKAAASRRDRL